MGRYSTSVERSLKNIFAKWPCDRWHLHSVDSSLGRLSLIEEYLSIFVEQLLKVSGCMISHLYSVERLTKGLRVCMQLNLIAEYSVNLC